MRCDRLKTKAHEKRSVNLKYPATKKLQDI
jgi:hypothetical protein